MRKIPYPGQLSAEPFAVSGLGLLLPNSEGSLLLKDLQSEPVAFPLPVAWFNRPAILANGILANFSIMEAADFYWIPKGSLSLRRMNRAQT